MKLCCLNRTKCTIECEYAIVSEPRSGIALSVSFDIGTNADAGKDSQSAVGYVELYDLNEEMASQRLSDVHLVSDEIESRTQHNSHMCHCCNLHSE